MSTDDLYKLAADLANEHGVLALEYARRAVLAFDAEGARDRAEFWQVLSVLLDDIMTQRLDPDAPITLH
ncbi:MAG TPA: hypothetical protein VG891_13990 [Rhizomicrobium sp.]|nr:hypothetical protein [Rhizomicrobium sp.]